MNSKPKCLGREHVFSGNILDVYKDIVDTGNGNTEEWDCILHKTGGACVVPVLENEKILLVRQYRLIIDRETLELPAGKRDFVNVSGKMIPEDPSVTASREMLEETGYFCPPEKLISLAKIMPAPAYCSEIVSIFLAMNPIDTGSQHLDSAESITAQSFSLNELLNMIFSGKLQDSKTVAGILAYAAMKSGRPA